MNSQVLQNKEWCVKLVYYWRLSVFESTVARIALIPQTPSLQAQQRKTYCCRVAISKNFFLIPTNFSSTTAAKHQFLGLLFESFEHLSAMT